ncbi:Uncharacterized protein OBRU01_19403 [Operophtera brumata]|uniref:PH domain-containing protein n=1 Tax=Operophtera brumata TaxID=104452 RepID=A0A0L7KWG5_OPEBR|nr:Uncharacterized protein OBRU01_19403 [Operophtera brumata]
MKINDKNLSAFASSATPVDREGWLDMRVELGKNYQRRWFTLKGNLLFYFDKKGEKEPAEKEAKTILTDLNDVYQRTADMTGKTVSTVRRVVPEGDRNKGVFSTPGKNIKGRPKKQLDNFDLCAIRQNVKFFYTVRKQVPTLRNLLPVVREDLGYDGSREHLRKILIALGFKYKRCHSERTALIERPNIAAKRAAYLFK